MLNNLVEAKVSVDRVQGFLLEGEKKPISAYPLRKTGALLHKATMVWESGVKRKHNSSSESANKTPKVTMLQRAVTAMKETGSQALATVTCGRYGTAAGAVGFNSQLSPTSNPMITRTNSNVSVASVNSDGKPKPAVVAPVPSKAPAEPLSEAEFLSIVSEAHALESERVIIELEKELATYRRAAAVENSSTLSGKYSDNASLDSSANGGALFHTSSFASDIGMLEQDGNSPRSDPDSRAGSPNPNGAPTEAGKHARVLTLSRINLQARAGQLVSVVGAVGSGKSSLLSALLGDMRCCFGNVAVYGSIAYAAQVAFIQNSTLKENIVYGNPYDEALYQDTLRMCALLPDIKVLPAGHDTEIGERGINLSGGQKARVGLARAVYANADIYLLDDPLSAVDAHVGQHLFEECIMDLKRRGKCVILVTNALQFLKQSSHILVLKDGRISESGQYDTLLKYGKGFTEMIATMQDTSSSNTKNGETECDEADLEEIADAVLPGGSPSAAVGKSRSRSLSASTPAGKKRSGSVQVEDAKVSIKKSASLITTEDREVGNVSLEVYGKWAVAAGGMSVGKCLFLFTLFICFCLKLKHFTFFVQVF